MSIHRYRTNLAWQGSTGSGYRDYSRTHLVGMPPAETEFRVSADPVFLGDAALPNPEQLLVAAASSCLLLMFLAEAARAGVDVLDYTDDAEGELRGGRITRIVLRPQVRIRTSGEPVAAAYAAAQVESLLHTAHAGCYIANSLTSDVVVEPVVETEAAA